MRLREQILTRLFKRQKELTETMDDLISDEDFPSYKDIIANRDFTEFDVFVIREAFENSFDGFGILDLHLVHYITRCLMGSRAEK